jgi:hypothetical protein
MRSRHALAAVAAGLLAAALPSAAGATFPGATGLIGFQSDRRGDFGIFTSNADASNPQPLYDRPGTHEFNPAWSPSGTYVVLQTGPLDRSTFDLVVVDVVTGEATPLLDGPENDHAAQFCDPDTVIFTRQTDPANADIWTIDVDGSDTAKATGNLTQLTDAPGRQSFPTCSPDSTRIAYISDQTGTPAIWEMNADGTGQHELVPGPSLDPDYTPDWEGLTYAAPDPTDGNLEIFELYLDTGETEQLTHTPPPIQNRLIHYAPDYPNGTVEVYFTRIDPRLAFPETNLALPGDPSGDPTTFCGNPPPGDPGVPPNPPPGDPGGPKNNSAAAPQPTASCALNDVGTLTVEGTEGPDVLNVFRKSDGSVDVYANGTRTTYRSGLVTGVRILGKGGNDTVVNNFPDAEIDGGAGINAVNGIVTLTGTDQPDRAVVETTAADRFGVGGSVTITFNGDKATFDSPHRVELDEFDGRDTVVIDRESFVQVTDWLDIIGTGPGITAGIFITGTREDDRIAAKVEPRGPLRITLNGEQAPAIAGSVAGGIRILGGGGRDTIDANVPVTVGTNRRGLRLIGGRLLVIRVDAGTGADRITCRGKAQRCTVIAGTGNDTVDVRDGTRSVVDGGPGSDRVVADRADRVRRAETVIRG